jgi:hypothetical protein
LKKQALNPVVKDAGFTIQITTGDDGGGSYGVARKNLVVRMHWCMTENEGTTLLLFSTENWF